MSAGHADDGELIRLVDGECSAEERAWLEGHLATCGPCAERRDTLARLSGAITAALATGDRIVRPQRWRTAALRAAAVLLLVAAAAASAQPARAWLSARWADVRALVAPRAGPRSDSPGAATVRFVPTTSVFTIEVVARQEGGVLTIELSGDTIATASVTPGTRGEELIVLPAGLRIVNRPRDRARYDVRLPRGVGEVRLRIAGAPERRLVPAQGARQWTMDLNPPEM